jgi:hypothetical protein
MLLAYGTMIGVIYQSHDLKSEALLQENSKRHILNISYLGRETIFIKMKLLLVVPFQVLWYFFFKMLNF